MVRKRHQDGLPFGVVTLTSGQEVRTAEGETERFYTVGTLAHITQLQSAQPGLLHIQCVGQSRFQIVRFRQLPYGLWVADAQRMQDDQAIAIPPDLQGTSETLAHVLHNLHLRQTQHEDRVPQGDAIALPTQAQLSDCSWVANRWCELLPIPTTLKQQLLELDSPLLRLELVSDVLERTGIAF